MSTPSSSSTGSENDDEEQQQQQQQQQQHVFTIHTSVLFDPVRKQIRQNLSLTVSRITGLITSVQPRSAEGNLTLGPDDIDLRHLFVMPSLVDAHTHIFLHPYSETPALVQMRDESPVERVVRATNHVRAALLAGYTTYRDLGSEAMGAWDARFRDTINRGLIPGPRLFVATEAIASDAGYQPRTENASIGGLGTRMPRGSDEGDGAVGVRRAVRRRIADGADVIKFYADYRRRVLRWPSLPNPSSAHHICCPVDDPNPEVPLFRQDEMDEIVLEARLAKCPVAAHAGGLEAALMAVRAGVTTLEHGYFGTNDLFALMRDHDTIFVPTLAVCEALLDRDRLPHILATTKLAWTMGVKLACGGDTGTFPHGDNARELELMVAAGVPVEDVLVAATLRGWESCGGDWCGMKFGWFEEGCRADLVGLRGSPLDDVAALRKVDFVMKDGRIWKRDGAAVGII